MKAHDQPNLTKADVDEFKTGVNKLLVAKLKEVKERQADRTLKKPAKFYPMGPMFQSETSKAEDDNRSMGLAFFNKVENTKKACRAKLTAGEFKVLASCCADRAACMLGMLSRAREDMHGEEIRALLKYLRTICRDVKSIGLRASDMGLVQSGIAAAVLISDDYEGNASEGFLGAVEKQWILLGKKPGNYLQAVAAASNIYKGAAKRSRSADAPDDNNFKKNNLLG